MTLILQVAVVGCSVAVVAIAARAFRVADRVPPSLTVATHSMPTRDRRAPAPALTDPAGVEHGPQRATEQVQEKENKDESVRRRAVPTP